MSHAACTHPDYSDWMDHDGVYSTRREITCADCRDRTIAFLAGGTWIDVPAPDRGAHRSDDRQSFDRDGGAYSAILYRANEAQVVADILAGRMDAFASDVMADVLADAQTHPGEPWPALV